MVYYAKSSNRQGHRETVKEHLQKVADLAQEYGEPLELGDAAALAGQVHDFGKYSIAFQEVMKGLRTGIDHAMGGALFLECCYKGKSRCRPVIEAVNGHHDGLTAYDTVKNNLHAVVQKNATVHGNEGKTPSIESREQLLEALVAFQKDFPDFRPPKQLPAIPPAEL